MVFRVGKEVIEASPKLVFNAIGFSSISSFEVIPSIYDGNDIQSGEIVSTEALTIEELKTFLIGS